MNIKIAVIGSRDFCNQTDRLAVSLPDIELEYYHYQHPKQASELISTLKPCDAVLFSGSLPYFYANDAIEHLPIPTLYLKQDETAIAISLLHLATQQSLNLHRISIDVREELQINHILNDSKISQHPPYIHLLQDDEKIDIVTDFHRQLAEMKLTDMAVTSIHAVYERLQKLQIPAMKMIDPESSILNSIELAKQQALLQKSNSAQIAVGIVKGKESTFDPNPVISKLAHLLRARWSEENGEFTLYTTMGNIYNSLKDEEFLRFHQTIKHDAKFAFGCGETIVDATENAHFAIGFIRNDADHSFYVLDAQKRLHGPFPHSNNAIEMKVNSPILKEMAEKTKLSPANISKLMQFSQSRHAKYFTANDLSLHLSVTRRTAERTLKKLIEFDYVKIIGEEMAYKQGRPRSLYEFNFSTY